MKVGDLVWYEGGIQTLLYDFMLSERQSTYVMHTWGEINSIVNNGTHAVVDYGAHVPEGFDIVRVLIPVDLLKEDTENIKESDRSLHA